MRGWACARLGDQTGAQANLRRALALQPDHPRVRQMEAEMAMTRRDWSAAMDAYRHIADQRVDAAIAKRMAALAETLQQPAVAAHWYRRVIADEPWQSDAYWGLARCLRIAGDRRRGERAQAERLARYWDEARERLAYRLYQMSARYRQRWQWTYAQRAARAALMITPSSERAGTSSPMGSGDARF